jgi:hypothetical protein
LKDEAGDLIAHGYDQVADEYAALESEQTPWPRLARVKDFIAELPDGSYVLDLGVGMAYQRHGRSRSGTS